MTNYVSKRQYKRLLRKTRFFFVSTVVFLIATIALSTVLVKTFSVKTDKPIIVGSGELQKVDDNTFEIVEEEPITSVKIDIPPEIGHQEDLPDMSNIPEISYELLK